MTNIQRTIIRDKQYKALFGLLIATAVIFAGFIGFSMDGPENCMIIPQSPLSEGFLLAGAVDLCIGDLAVFWIIGIGVPRGLRLALSVCVFSFRGLLIGSSLRILLGNSVPVTVAVFLLSYIAISLLAFVCDCYLNTGCKKGFVTRFCACLLTTGAATVIRLLPLLLLEL